MASLCFSFFCRAVSRDGSQLYHACRVGDGALVQQLIVVHTSGYGGDGPAAAMNWKDEVGALPEDWRWRVLARGWLVWACEESPEGRFVVLACAQDGNSSLFVAAFQGHLDICRQLLAAAASPTAANKASLAGEAPLSAVI